MEASATIIEKIRLSGHALNPRDDEDLPDFWKRRRTEMRRWYIEEGATFADLAVSYELSQSRIRDIVLGGRQNRQPSKAIRATREHLACPAPTIEEARSEEPVLVNIADGVDPERSFARSLQMWRWRKAGMTLEEIGSRHGISRERVSQILLSHGFPTLWKRGWKSQPKASDTPKPVD